MAGHGLLIIASLIWACGACDGGAKTKPKGREAAPERDDQCRDAALPKAYFYPAENRTDYQPDDPFKDGCQLLVADHLFCCPAS